MIKNAIYTYWTDNGDKYNSGFSSFGGFKRIFKKSIESVEKSFEKIKIYTDIEGKDKLESIEILERERSNQDASIEFILIDYSEYDFDSRFWNFPKMISYNLQTEPFLHIDTDVVFHNKLENLDGEIVTEMVRNALIWNSERSFLPKDINSKYSPHLLCSGIIGGSDIQIFKDAYDIAEKLVKWDYTRLYVTDQNRIAIEEIVITVLSNKKKIKPLIINKEDFIHYQSVAKNNI